MQKKSVGWVPLKCPTHYSLMRTPIRAKEAVARAVQLGQSHLALTDYGNLAASVEFVKACKEVCSCGHFKDDHDKEKCLKKGCLCGGFAGNALTGILGSHFFIQNDSMAGDLITVLARNKEGWNGLIRATSEANTRENWIKMEKPSLTLEKLIEFSAGNWIIVTGSVETEIAQTLLGHNKLAYLQKDQSSAKSLLTKEDLKKAIKLVGEYREGFGKDNVFLETQLFDADRLPIMPIISSGMRYIAKKVGVECVATTSPLYYNRENVVEQNILMASAVHATMETVKNTLIKKDRPEALRFFTSSEYCLHVSQHIQKLHEDFSSECDTSLQIAQMCEQYEILNRPELPAFDCPGGIPSKDYLKHLCVQGWNKKIKDDIAKDKQGEYRDRIRHELDVLTSYDVLVDYFLIVQDYVQAARNRGEGVGPGRGSSGGCLTSYLLDITRVDPILYDLLFERFYNAGRNTADRVSLPDIDIDFQTERRKDQFKYIEDKYDKSRVGQMITFTSMKGKAALSEVYRIQYPTIPFDEVKLITNIIPDEAKIADELQTMRENDMTPSILLWSLEHHKKELEEFCYIDDDGNLQGNHKQVFQHALNLEGTYKAQSKHASGLVISKRRLADFIPMVYDKGSRSTIPGLTMNNLADMGCVKFDILGIDAIDFLKDAKDIIAGIC